jgi:hypothetical protein
MNDTSKALPGTASCTGNTYPQNITTTTTGTTSQCSTPTGTTYTNSSPLTLIGTNFGLATSGITAGRYGNATAVTVCDIDTYGRATSCTNTSITIPTDQNNYTTGAGLNTTGSTLELTTNITGRSSIYSSITMNDTSKALAGYINTTGALTCIQNLSLLSTGLSYSSITIPTDQNNYTAAFNYNQTITKLIHYIQLNINRTGMNNLSTTFTDYNNYTYGIGFNQTTSGLHVLQLNLNISNNVANLTGTFNDYNNYTWSIGFNRTGNTVQFNINISGSANNLTGTFNDNTTIMIGFNATGSTLQLNVNNSVGGGNLTTTITMNDTSKAIIGYYNCTGNQVLQNYSITSTSTTGNCITPTSTGNGNITYSIGTNSTGATVQTQINISGNNLSTTFTQNITGSGADTKIAIWNGASTLTTDGLYYNYTDNKLCINCTSGSSISQALQVNGNINITGCIYFATGGKICSI